MLNILFLAALCSAQIELNDENFEEYTKVIAGVNHTDWMLLVYNNDTSSHGQLKDFAEISKLEVNREDKINIGQLNYEDNPITAKRLKIENSPNILLIRKNRAYNMTSIESAKEVRSAIESANIKKFSSRRIPEIQTTMKWLMKTFSGFVINNLKYSPTIFILSCIGFMFLLVVLIILCTTTDPEKDRKNKPKNE